MTEKLKNLILYLNTKSSFVKREDLHSIEILNTSQRLLPGDTLTIPTILGWAFSQTMPVHIVCSSSANKVILVNQIKSFKKLAKYNYVTLSVTDSEVDVTSHTKILYLNLYELRLESYNSYSDMDLSTYYTYFKETLTPKVFDYLRLDKDTSLSITCGINLSDHAIEYLETCLQASFKEYTYLYAYSLAYLVGEYVMRRNMDYEVLNGKILINGTYSKLHSTYTPHCQLIHNFLSLKHGVPYQQEDNVSSVNITDSRVYGAYLNYKVSNTFILVKSEKEKLRYISERLNQLTAEIDIICDSTTLSTANHLKAYLTQQGVTCTIFSNLFTLKRPHRLTIDITDVPSLVNSDLKLCKAGSLQDTLTEREAYYKKCVAKWNSRFKLNSELNYLNANLIKQYRTKWLRNTGNTDLSTWKAIETIYLDQAYSTLRKYRSVQDYCNSMHRLLDSLYLEHIEKNTGKFNKYIES